MGLLLGLIITLAAVVAYSFYIRVQLSGLRKLQSEMVDRNRKDSLQLLRVQNDLNSIGLAMRDMLDASEPYPLSAWTAQFERIREDLDVALHVEEQLASANRTTEQRKYLSQSVAQFWDAVTRMFALAAGGKEAEAREQIRLTLQARQESLSTAVSRLLVQNNEGEEQAAGRIAQIYDGVQRQLYLFLGATLIAIVLTSLYLIRTNRIIFARLAALSEQRSELAQKLIATQESTLRHISRELHDEFGQVLTAIGSLLGRAGSHLPEGSKVREEVQEVREIAQSTLDNIRSLSQALHPVLLEEAGLVSTLDWYIPTVERQSGIALHYEKSGTAFPLDGGASVHVYRVLQEALNNVSRHSGAKEAWARLKFLPDALELEIEDHGKGILPEKNGRGIGLVAMRERAELIGGKLARWCDCASSVRKLRHMRDKLTVLLVDDHALVRRGFRRILEDDAEIEVVGEASDGEEAVRLAAKERPEVIVMDCAMPGMNGLEATRRILEARPEAAILMLSMHSEDTLVRQALDAGARGYILKNAMDLDLANAVKRVAKGEKVLDPQVAHPTTLKGEREGGLTPRELEVLQRIVAGKSNKEIAAELNLSANTVSVHRANIMDALGIHKTAELVVYAIRNGLVSLP